MLARPTPAQAFPVRARTQAVYLAQHPVWYVWSRVGSHLWSVAPALDAPGLAAVSAIARVSAWTLDLLFQGAPADVGVWTLLGPAVQAAWRTWVDMARQVPPATPQYTLSLTPAADSALAALRAWDPVRQTAQPPAPDTLLVTVLEGLGVVPIQAGTTPAPGAVRLHTLTSADTLPGLATRYLGDPEAWPRIRALNRLRAPYLSPRLWDQYGPPVLAYVLGTTATSSFLAAPVVTAGATTIVVPTATPGTCPVGAVLVLETWQAGQRVQEAVTVTAFATATATATVTPAVQNTYGVASLLSLNVPPSWYTTQVLAPGQTIQIPQAGRLPDPALTTPTDPLGTDLAVDPDGHMAWTGSGDVAVATGVANVQGALTRRLTTALGTLPLHPDYGSNLSGLVGQPLVDSHVIRSFVRVSLLADPRVEAVRDITVTAVGTTWQITAVVHLVFGPGPVPLRLTYTA